MAIYSDKHSIFRVNQKDRATEQPNANTPQAKGRVERANQTLTGELFDASANAFLPEITDYNQRFSVAPKTSQRAP